MRGDRQVWFWLAALACLVLAVALLRDVLLPFLAGGAIAYFLNPVADRLERLGLGRTLAAGLIVGAVSLLMLLALVLLAPLAIAQLSQLIASLPADLARIRDVIEGWAEQRLGPDFPALKTAIERAVAEVVQGSSGLLGGLALGAWSRGLALINLASLLLVTPLVVFYLLRDWRRTLERIDAWLPRDHAPAVRAVATDIDRAVGAFIRGQGTICLVLGAFYAVSLSAAGLHYGLVIGLLTGLFSFVPFVGWATGLLTAVIAAVAQAWPDPTLAIVVVGIFLAAMAIDTAILSPNIVGHRIGLHPVWLLFALFAFGALMGLVGMLVAVPVAAALAVVARFARDVYLGSSVYLGSRPAGTLVGCNAPET
jgi:predicted PurR-regulated permease PerM